MTGPQELIFLMLIIAVLSMSGLWPHVIRGIKELRGEHVEEPRTSAPPSRGSELDLCFKMLGVSPTAPWEEIERAYHKKAKLHHPDLGGDEDTMRALNDAYNAIKRLRKAAGKR